MGQLISPEYMHLQRQLHVHGNYGISSHKWVNTISQVAHMYQCKQILDYGCGAGQLKAALGSMVQEYDPCISGKNADPVPSDMVVCTDVLEHIEPELLDNVLKHLAKKTRKIVFLTIALRPAKKTLADGRNAHLIIETSAWWRNKLEKYFNVTEWTPYEDQEVAGIALAKNVKPVSMGKVISSISGRRKLSPLQKKSFETFFHTLREGSKRYSDPLCVLETFGFWEGIDDKPADCLFVIDILEHQIDVHTALADIKRLANHAALIVIRPDWRKKDYWNNLIKQYFLISETLDEGGVISFVANRKTIVPGINVIAAGTDDGRWENIKQSVLKYPVCVQEAPAHGRRAIIGCYGPSLQETWYRLREEAQEPETDVVSVSGAHDFLLEKGIIPRFHVECDPRPHKADNIRALCPETEYLLASTCHPKLFEKLSGAKVRLWHAVDGEPARRIVDELKSKAPIVFGGGNVGMRALSVLYRMGYRKMSIYGMDCSFSEDGSTKWAGPHAQKENQKEFPLIRVNYNGRMFTTTWILLTYGTDFFDMINRMMERDPSIEFKLYGDGLLQARVAGPPLPIKVLLDNQEAA